jgi:hypothetical protein
MTSFRAIVAGLLIGATLASPVLAAEEACLQANRVWGWQALNDRTLIVTDRTYNRYTVRLSGGCINLAQNTSQQLVFRTKTSLGCVSAGDRVAFNSPGLGPLTCFVNAVEEAPKQPAK